MKLTTLLEATKEVHPLIAELKGKKLDWEQMLSFIDKSEFFSRSGKGDIVWELKADAGVNVGPVITALKKACDSNVTVTKGQGKNIHIDWNFDVPVAGTVMKASNGYQTDVDRDKLFKWGMQHAKQAEGGGKGWFVSHGDGNIIARFDEGPHKGDMCRLAGKIGTKYKEGDKIKVLYTSVTYGKTKIA